MDLGRVKSSIFDRSIYKLIRERGKLKIDRAYLGNQVAKATFDNEKIATAMSSKPNAVIDVSNKLHAKGYSLEYVMVNVTLDLTSREIRLKEIISDIESQCVHFNITIANVSAAVSARAIKPIVTVIGVGKSINNKEFDKSKLKPGDNIVAIGVIGLSGIRRIIEARKDEILSRYSKDVIDKALGDLFELDMGNVADLVREQFDIDGVDGNIYAVSEGGIFDALWNISEYNHKGFEVDIRAIPVRQEIIEICEMFSINPYEMESIGTLLVTYSGECGIVNILNEKNVPARVIGTITNGRDKKIKSLSEERFMEMPGQDEILKIVDVCGPIYC